MEVFATTSTIATKIDVREKAPKEMSICFRSVLFYKLKQQFSLQFKHSHWLWLSVVAVMCYDYYRQLAAILPYVQYSYNGTYGSIAAS